MAGKKKESTLQARDRKRKYRAELSDTKPEVVERNKTSERERSRTRQNAGCFKNVSQMSKEKHEAKKEYWKAQKQKQRQAKSNQTAQEEAPPLHEVNIVIEEPPAPLLEIPSRALHSRQSTTGKKIVRKNKAKLLKELETVRKDRDLYKRKFEKWKKRSQRGSKKPKTPVTSNNSSQTSQSPRKVVNNIMAAGSEKVYDELLVAQVIQKQLKKNSRQCKSLLDKRYFAKHVGGSVVKRYRLEKELDKRKISSYHLRMKYGSHTSVETQLKRSSKFEKIKSEIRNFFEDDDTSIMTPGKKQFITRRKVRKQRRFLRDSLKNLHMKFVEKTGIKISYVSFIKYKPFWVVPPKESDRNTCRCDKHANFDFIVNTLARRKILKDVKNRNDLLSEVSCDVTKKACMLGECTTCNTKKIPEKMVDFSNHDSVHLIFFYQWIKKPNPEIKTKSGKCAKLTIKEKKRSTQENLIRLLEGKLPEFCRHVFVERHQRTFQKDLIKDCRFNEVAINIDWSENYNCKYEEEVQARHFGASQVSLHTGVIYLKGGKIKIPFCTVSNCCRHDASAIWAHLSPILDLIQNDHPNIDTFHFFSDGPTPQYRNKSNFYLFQKFCLERKFYQASWNFSEAGHGKGTADGVGGALKRTADSAVLKKKFDVVDAETFVEAVSTVKILKFVITKEEIEKVDPYIPETLTAIPKTMQMRQLTWSSKKPQELGLRMLSCKTCFGISKCEHYQIDTGVYVQQHLISTNTNDPHFEREEGKKDDSSNTADVGDFVAILVDNDRHPGKVIQKMKNSLCISLMAKSREYYVWPPKAREVVIKEYEWLYKLKPPAGNRSERLFVFKEFY